MKGKRVFSILLALLMGLPMMAMFTVAPQAYNDLGDLQFRKDGSFRILQITDLQHSGLISTSSNKFIHALIKESDPDLIVLTGDNVAGNGSYESKIRSFMDILGHMGIPVAVVFGNHDSEAGNKSAQLAIYRSYTNCLMVNSDPDYAGVGTIESDRVGNYNLPVRSRDGQNPYAYNLWFFDTGERSSNREVMWGWPWIWNYYDGITMNTVNWYKWKAGQLKERNNDKTVPAIAFQHITVPEVELCNLPEQGNAGYNVSNNTSKEYNYKGEVVCPPNTERYNKQIDAHFSVGDVKAIFYGHDHKNHYRVTYANAGNSIDLVCTGGTGDGSYTGAYRCGRLITIYENQPNRVDTETYVYKGESSPTDPTRDLTGLADKYTSAQIAHNSMGQWQGVAATCVVPEGTQVRYCNSGLCGFKETKEGNGLKAPCTPGGYQTVLTPTCTEKGKEERRCTVCNKLYDERDIAADNVTHTAAENWVQTLAPTCSAAGTLAKKCIRCETVMETDTIPIDNDNHSPAGWEVTTLPTCSAFGVKELRCSLCSNFYDTDEVAKDGDAHNPGSFEEFLPATCQTTGESRQHCQDCETLMDTEVLPIKPSAHTLLAWRTISPASCSKEGSEEQYCVGCGVVTTNRVIAKNNKHTAGEWDIITIPTCGSTGLRIKPCADCNMTMEAEGMLKDPSNHAEGEWVPTTAATCGAKGSSELRCKYCPDVVLGTREEPINPDKHIPGGEWAIVTQPSCMAEGLKELRCAGADCSAVMETAPVEKTAHRAGSWQTILEPTCAVLGEEELLCADCGTGFERAPLDMTTHQPGEWVQVLGANCAKEGKKELRCEDCSAVIETASIAKTAHKPGNWKQTLAPTCVKAGAAEQSCLGCSAVLEIKEVPIDPEAHNFGDWVTATKPTATAYGVETRSCTRCPATETRQMPKLQTAPVISGPTTVSYKSTIQLQADQSVIWGGSNQYIKVHDDGTVESLKGFSKLGSAQVSATGNGKTTYYTVKVSPSFGQWMLIIFLFGWIWL